MLAQLTSVTMNLANRAIPPDDRPAPTYPAQFLPTWSLPDRIALDAAQRRYPYKPAPPPQDPRAVLRMTNAIFDSWNASLPPTTPSLDDREALRKQFEELGVGDGGEAGAET